MGLQVLLQAGLLRRGHEQAELAAPPEDIGAAASPFLAAQVIHLAGIEPGAEVFAEVGEVVHAVEQAPAAAAVAGRPASGQAGRQPAMARAERFDQGALAVQLLAAGQDRTPVSAVEEFAAEVPVDAEVRVYPDAPHSFFDRRFAEHREACEDAWRQILAFFDRLAG